MDIVGKAPHTPDIGAHRWLAPVCLCGALAVTGYGLAAYLSGADKVVAAVQRIGGAAMAAGLAATALSLTLRAWRWRLILARLGWRLGAGLQARVYFSGLALSSTPGKLGETTRSVLLRPHGVAYPDSLAAFVCDRLADTVGVAALGAAAAALAGHRQVVLEAITLLALAGSLTVAALWRAKAAAAGAARRRPWIAVAAATATGWARLWLSSALPFCIGIAAAAYGLQGLVFAGFVGQLHAGLGWAACLAIFVNATLIGAASMVPGGLGTMDAALVLQLQAAGVAGDAALAAALATRACTLWFAWLLGIVALLTFGRPAAA